MAGPQSDGDGAARPILIIGDGELVDVAQRALGDVGVAVLRLARPTNAEVRAAMAAEVEAVMVIDRDDRVSLRFALVVEAIRPGVRLIVTIYNRDLGAELRRAVPNVRVMSMGEIVAPSLTAACLAEGLVSVRSAGARPVGVTVGPDGPALIPLTVHAPNVGERVMRNVTSLLHPFELSAKTLLSGLLGFLVILVSDSLVLGLGLHESAPAALYSATKTIVTVGPNLKVDDGPAWLKLYSAAMMLAALAFTAVFIAGLIDRLIDRRLVAILGPRTMPRRNHVVVVGLGQVGLRLCMMLRTCGVPVVAVERDPEIDNIRRARQYGVPVVIGRGSSRAVLRRLSLGRARAIAAVTSDEIENVAVVVAGLAMRGSLRTVLRAGNGDVLDETRALFRVGAVRDVYRISGALLAAGALGSSAEEAFAIDDTVWVIGVYGHMEPCTAHLERAVAALRARAPVAAGPAGG